MGWFQGWRRPLVASQTLGVLLGPGGRLAGGRSGAAAGEPSRGARDPGQQLPHRGGLQSGPRRRAAHQLVRRALSTATAGSTASPRSGLSGLAHQLSYTLPVAEAGADGTAVSATSRSTIGISSLGNGEAKLACAPRLSMLFPTGSARKGLGVGGLGLQVGLPFSLVLGKHLVSHANLGFTHVFSARDALDDRASLSTYNLGASLVWLATSRFNVLTEIIWTRAQSVTGPGRANERRPLAGQPGHPLGLQLQERPPDRPGPRLSPRASDQATARSPSFST